jgi:hypothetical protein
VTIALTDGKFSYLNSIDMTASCQWLSTFFCIFLFALVVGCLVDFSVIQLIVQSVRWLVIYLVTRI